MDAEKAIDVIYSLKGNTNVEYVENGDIGCDLAIEALEKQIAKKPVEELYEERDGEDWYDTGTLYDCPNCKHNVGKYSNEIKDWIFQENHCDDCGQKLVFSEMRHRVCELD